MPVRVRRTALTGRTWSPVSEAKLLNHSDGVRIAFDLPSAGGGFTQVECIIDADVYADLARYMMEQNEVAATRAFAKALMTRDYGIKIADAERA